MIEVVLRIAILILLFIVFKKYLQRRKEKEWLMFEDVWGTNNNLQKQKYAINRKTGERRNL